MMVECLCFRENEANMMLIHLSPYDARYFRSHEGDADGHYIGQEANIASI